MFLTLPGPILTRPAWRRPTARHATPPIKYEWETQSLSTRSSTHQTEINMISTLQTLQKFHLDSWWREARKQRQTHLQAVLLYVFGFYLITSTVFCPCYLILLLFCSLIDSWYQFKISMPLLINCFELIISCFFSCMQALFACKYLYFIIDMA